MIKKWKKDNLHSIFVLIIVLQYELYNKLLFHIHAAYREVLYIEANKMHKRSKCN